MEAFSLLKYWRGGGTNGGDGGNACVNTRSTTTAGGTTTIVTALTTHQAVDTDDDADDDGPFFDLEFAVPDEDETEETEEHEKIDEEGDNVDDEESEDQNDDFDAKSDDGCSDGEREFNFTLSSGSSNDRSDPNLTLSPSDDLFFKGRLVPIEPNSSSDSKPPQFPVSLLKSATKFRVFLLRFKKSKLNSTEKTEPASANGSVSVPTATPKKQETTQEENNNNKNKFFTVKFKVEEVPLMSLFSRDNSKSQKQKSSEDSVSDEKKFSKDVMQKYLKKVKPLYVRVSRRYGEKLRFSGQLSLGSVKPATPPSTGAQKPVSGKVTIAEKGQVELEVGENQVNGKNLKQVNIPAGIRVVCKHLGKSRSASSAVAAASPAPALSKRRDDSLLQQQDGIQSAILHCKRSFNGSRDSSESSVLPRSVSDPSHEKSINLSRKSSPDEAKA
ncbi:probable membrane-associated kinase regulator 2 [Durio zibethinus]|uniref:Probable membrane-associated kinase regulator 2 n=1 Tax=Durio zibethinus TaxID=66656 RepID=A0A6P5YC63_DURZI|nr:probable membrane-associated kinase regulator 2 [Durio zibethinus]